MKSSITRIPATAILFCCAVFTQAQAQNSGPVLVDIAPCMNLAGNAERYECYDKLEEAVRAAQQRSAPRLSAAPPAAPVTPAASDDRAAVTIPAVPAQTTATSVAEFGQQSPAAAEAATVRANQDGEEELHDRIVNVQEREPGRALITLESGQVWYQSNSQRFRLVKGMAVRIYPSPLRGSYRLARDDGKQTGFIQVERVK